MTFSGQLHLHGLEMTTTTNYIYHPKEREMVLYLILSHQSPLISQSLQGDLVRKGDALELLKMHYNLMVDYAFD